MAVIDDAPHRIFYIMSDQPDCCSKCCSRLELIKIVPMEEEERVFVSWCHECQREVLIVED